MEPEIIVDLKELQNRLEALPYGVPIRNGEKILPPLWHEYANVVDDIICKLIELLSSDSKAIACNDVDYVRSLRENDVNRAMVDRLDHKERFETNGYGEEMLRISNCIASVISRIYS